MFFVEENVHIADGFRGLEPSSTNVNSQICMRDLAHHITYVKPLRIPDTLVCSLRY